MKASIVIIYTDMTKLNKAKLWIERQSIFKDIELIAMDNRDGQFSSCAQGLNHGAEQSGGEYLLFMHQDVYLWDLQAVEKYCEYLSSNPHSVIGVAGVCANGDIVTDICETEEKIERGSRARGKVFQVDALDECLIAMKRERWEQLRFDPECCDNWHGYGMEICYHNVLEGGTNEMVPLQICHDSQGTPHTASFRRTIHNLVRKYQGTQIKRLYGTCIQIPCSWRGYYSYEAKECIKKLLRLNR